MLNARGVKGYIPQYCYTPIIHALTRRSTRTGQKRPTGLLNVCAGHGMKLESVGCK